MDLKYTRHKNKNFRTTSGKKFGQVTACHRSRSGQKRRNSGSIIDKLRTLKHKVEKLNTHLNINFIIDLKQICIHQKEY